MAVNYLGTGQRAAAVKGLHFRNRFVSGFLIGVGQIVSLPPNSCLSSGLRHYPIPTFPKSQFIVASAISPKSHVNMIVSEVPDLVL